MDSRPLGTIDYSTLKQQICNAAAFELAQIARILVINPRDSEIETFIEVLDEFKTSLKTALLFWRLGEAERLVKRGRDADRSRELSQAMRASGEPRNPDRDSTSTSPRPESHQDTHDTPRTP